MFCALVFCGSLLAVATAIDVPGDLGEGLEEGFVIDDANEPIVPLSEVLPGDILISDFLDVLLNLGDEGGAQRKKRTTAIKDRRWTKSTVPYIINTDFFTPLQVEIIIDSMKTWQTATCVKFRPARRRDKAILSFEEGNPGICGSYVGMIGGIQPIKLESGCLNNPGIILHEIGHALGLHHEHIHPDRDDYVIYYPENVKDGLGYNFNKLGSDQVLDTGLPYDYRSIMHYGPKAFSKNGQNTLETIDPNYQNVIGQRSAITALDIETVNKMYSC